MQWINLSSRWRKHNSSAASSSKNNREIPNDNADSKDLSKSAKACNASESVEDLALNKRR